MVCFLRCFQITVILRRLILLLSQQGQFMMLKRVCGFSLDVAYCLCRICKANSTEFARVSLSTLKVSFLLKIMWNRKGWGGNIFSPVN